MPGSGKTTVGKALSEKLEKVFVDTDDLIKEKYGDISGIFRTYGEDYFRDIEEEIVKKAAYESGCVIATGGGAIFRKDNILRLRQNGKVFFLDRPLEDILPTDDRPLSRDREALQKRYNERYGIYKAAADEIISVDGSIDDTVRKIMELI